MVEIFYQNDDFLKEVILRATWLITCIDHPCENGATCTDVNWRRDMSVCVGLLRSIL